MIKVGILVSGEGSNLAAILQSCLSGTLRDRIHPVVVISNNLKDNVKPKCKYYNEELRAKEMLKENYSKIAYYLIERIKFSKEIIYDNTLCKILQVHKVDLLLLAGYNRVLKVYTYKDTILHVYANKIINIHPSLLPAFPGMNSVKKALDYGVKITGCTTHWVDEGMDTGKIIKQKSCKIHPEDTLKMLLDRVHSLEHIIFIETLVYLYLNKKI